MKTTFDVTFSSVGNVTRRHAHFYGNLFVRPLAARHSKYEAAYQICFVGAIDAAMVDVTLNDLETKVKVIHFGTNRFLIYDFL